MKIIILSLILIAAISHAKCEKLLLFEYKESRSLLSGLQFMLFEFSEKECCLAFEYALPVSDNSREFLYPFHLTYIDIDGQWKQIETIPWGLMKPVRKYYNPNDGVLGICVGSSYLKPQLMRAIEKHNYDSQFLKIKFGVRASNNRNGSIMLDTDPMLLEIKDNDIFLVGYWKTSERGRFFTYSNTDEYKSDNMVKLEKPVKITETYTPTSWMLRAEF